jgi:hypothetical protein
MFTRCDDTVFRRLRTRFGLQGRTRNRSIDSPLELQPAPSLHPNELIRMRIETGGEQHTAQHKQKQEQENYEEKTKTKP